MSEQDSTSPLALPFRSEQLPGIGGTLRASPEDFQVEEIRAYLPSGEGDHTYLWVKKQERTTNDLVSSLAAHFGIPQREIGVAGMKDKYALTTQQLSLPPGIDTDKIAIFSDPAYEILEHKRHTNKLKTGHLHGNHFQIRVRNLLVSPEEAHQRTLAILACIGDAYGAPNWYAAQRFGRRGTNAQIGRAIVMEEKLPMGRPPRGKQRRLYISAYQSSLFNRFVAERIQAGNFDKVLDGDLLQKRDSGGLFATSDAVAEQERLNNSELSITGPMFGHKMKAPTENSDSWLQEKAILDSEKIEAATFSHLGKLAMGTRRPISLHPKDLSVEPFDEGIQLRFRLPAGAYATTLLREIMKPTNGFPN